MMRVDVTITLGGTESDVGGVLKELGTALARVGGHVTGPVTAETQPVVLDSAVSGGLVSDATTDKGDPSLPEEPAVKPRRSRKGKDAEAEAAAAVKRVVAEASAKAEGGGQTDDSGFDDADDGSGSDGPGDEPGDEDDVAGDDLPSETLEALEAGYGPNDDEDDAAYLKRLQELATNKSKTVGSAAVKATLHKLIGEKTMRQASESDDKVWLPAVERALDGLGK